MEKKNILFLCTGNSCRSQMAEAWARYYWSDRFNVYSAGIETHGMNQRAMLAMSEAGLDISGHYSKTTDSLKDIPFDYVVTVCGHAHENCPFFPAKTKILHRGFQDPPFLSKDAGNETEKLGPYRRVRDEIRDFIRNMDKELGWPETV